MTRPRPAGITDLLNEGWVPDGHIKRPHTLDEDECWCNESADRPAEPTPPTNDVLTDVKVVAGEPTPTPTEYGASTTNPFGDRISVQAGREPTPTGTDRPTTRGMSTREIAREAARRSGMPREVTVADIEDFADEFDCIRSDARQQPQPLDVDVERLLLHLRPHLQRLMDPRLTSAVQAVDRALRLSSAPARPSPTEEPHVR